MSSFTWSAMIFPNGTDKGALFNWASENPGCLHYGAGVWIYNEKIGVGVCDGNDLSYYLHPQTLTLNKWYQVALSYDAQTGATQISVDGIIKSKPIALLAPGYTAGSIVMGSR